MLPTWEHTRRSTSTEALPENTFLSCIRCLSRAGAWPLADRLPQWPRRLSAAGRFYERRLVPTLCPHNYDHNLQRVSPGRPGGGAQADTYRELCGATHAIEADARGGVSAAPRGPPHTPEAGSGGRQGVPNCRRLSEAFQNGNEMHVIYG